MKLDPVYFDRLLAGEIDGPILDLGQLANFWCVRAHVSDDGELEGLSPSETKAQLFLVYVGEVGNGGHQQYFWNSSGDLAVETIAALKALDETGLADALLAATAVFPSGRPSKDRSERQAVIDGLSQTQSSRLQELDRKVWVLMLDAHPRALAFLRSHSDDVLRTERE